MGRGGFEFDMRRHGGLAALFLCLAAFSPGAAFARHDTSKGAWERCLAKADANHGDVPMNTACNNAELQRRDAVLNQTYRSLRQRLPAARMRKVQEEERIWIKDRHALCQKNSVHEAGDNYTKSESGRQYQKLFLSSCLLDETEERIGYLRAIR